MTAKASAPAKRASNRQTKATKQKRKREPSGKVAVYDGTRLLGTIKAANKGFGARAAHGGRLGVFKTSRAAMLAICEHDKQRRPAVSDK